MAVVLEPVPLRAAGRQRQDRIEAVERLDGRFLIDGEHRRVVGRIHIQPNHVRRLGLEVGIVRLHVPLESMRLQPGAPPRLADEVVMNLQQPTELARAPVRAAVGRRLSRLLQHPRLHRRRQHRRRLAAIPRLQPVESLREKSLPPPVDVVTKARHRRFDRRVRGAIGQHQNHPRAARVLGANLETSETTFQFGSFISRQRQRHMARQRTRSYFSEYKPLAPDFGT